MSRETWRGLLELTGVLTPQLLNHNYNANTIKYRHSYKTQIQYKYREGCWNC